MFDWARGSMLKKLIELKLYRADWNSGASVTLKNWHTPWLLGLIQFSSTMRVLDVGSATPRFMQYLHDEFGCEVHALDASSANARLTRWGFSEETVQSYPEVNLHVGLAGEGSLPANHFDLITCISTLEHTYDHDSPLLPDRPMAHLDALRDIVRMLRPGGLFLMNWDLFLDNIPQHFGWDFEVDYQILRASGMRLLSENRRLRNSNYIFTHPDTLFVEPQMVLGFKLGKLRRGTAINILWKKPGEASKIQLRPRAELERLYFPQDETTFLDAPLSEPELTTDEIDSRFEWLISRATDVLGRTDVDGLDRVESKMRSAN